jgi:hypothetical protein
MAKAPTAVKTASVLAFERKLATSDAVMYSGSWQGNVATDSHSGKSGAWHHL